MALRPPPGWRGGMTHAAGLDVGNVPEVWGAWQSKQQASSPHTQVVSVRTGAGVKYYQSSGTSSPALGKQKPRGTEHSRTRATQAAGHTSEGPQGTQRRVPGVGYGVGLALGPFSMLLTHRALRKGWGETEDSQMTAWS